MQREKEEQGNLNDFLCVCVSVVQPKQMYGLFIQEEHMEILCAILVIAYLVNFKFCTTVAI